MSSNITFDNSVLTTEKAFSADTLIVGDQNGTFQERSKITSGYNKSNEMNDHYIEIINEIIFRQTLLPSMIYVILLLITGVPGNALVCYIYHKGHQSTVFKTVKNDKTRTTMKSSTIFILTLAWLDILNCLISLPVEIVLLRNFIQFDHPWICKISRYVAMVLNAASSCVLIAIALDRLLGINCQCSHRFTPTTAKKIVVISVIFSIVVSFPGILLYGTQTVYISPGAHGNTCLIDDRFVHTKYPFIHSMFLLATHLVCDLFFIFTYGVIGWKILSHRKFSGNSFQSDKRKISVHKEYKKEFLSENMTELENFPRNIPNTKGNIFNGDSDKEHENALKQKDYQLPRLRSNEHTENNNSGKSLNFEDITVHGKVFKAGKTTFMLFIVTVMFALTFAPYCVIAILRNISSGEFYGTLSNTEKILYQLFLRSYLLSSSVNPLIYSFLSVQFRRQCKIIFGRLFKC